MAGLGRKAFAASEVLTAANVQGYLMDQSVMVYDDATARTASLGTAVAEGMVTYLKDTNAVEVYDGSAWQGIESQLQSGTSGYTALSNGTAGITYQPVSHNYIINGAFDVWQRGTSFSNPQNGEFGADRFSFGDNGTPTGTLTRAAFDEGELEVAAFGGAKYYWNYQSATLGGSTFIDLRQNIEDVETLAGQTVTLSLYAKSNDAITIQPIQLQSFGSGGSSSTNQPQSSQSLTSSWARYTWTYTIPSNSGKTIGSGSYQAIFLRFGSLTDTFDVSIWGVQLEAGSVATPFKRHAPSLQGELAACQRYYLALGGTTNYPNSFGYAASTTEVRAIIPTPVPMRATPTLVDATPRIRIGSSNLAPSSTTVQGTLAGNGVQVSYAQTGMTANNPAVITHDGTAYLYAEL